MKKTGFSIVEVIVSIFVLAVMMTAGFRLVVGNIEALAQNKNKFLATYHSISCLEEIRNQRDTNIKNYAKLENLIEPEMNDTDWAPISIFDSSDETGFYKKRIITTDASGGNPATKITATCQIGWDKPSGSDPNHIVEISQILTQW